MRNNKLLNYILITAIIFTTYYITARVGLSLNAVNDFATLVWPPTGIALASLFILGKKYWPAVFAGAFAANLSIGGPILVSLGIAGGNAAEALVGAYLLKQVADFRPTLERVKDVFGLVVAAAFVSTLISATIGTLSLVLGSVIKPWQFDETWMSWWLGDMLGNLVVAPLILVWVDRPVPKLFNRKGLEMALEFLILIAVSVLIFRGLPWFGFEGFRFVYVVYPILIWIALQHGQRANLMAILIVSIIAITFTFSGSGPFNTEGLGGGLLFLQSFMGITAITFMTLAAVVAEGNESIKREFQLTRRTKQLLSQRASLVALNQTKDEFVAITSHQLRTPATAVKQYIGLLLQGYSDPLTKNQRLFLEKANEDNDRQLQIIDDLLRATQLDLDKIKLRTRKIDLINAVESATSALAGLVEGRNQKIILNKPNKKIIVFADREQLRTVIDNLLENASNYSYENSNITISIRSTKKIAKIQVIDEGVGIKKKDFPKLFQKFSRIDNPLSAGVSGTGLGLYLSKKIMVLHGGDIKVSSDYQKGTMFTLILPIEKTNAQAK